MNEPDTADSCAARLRVLADPTRLEVMRLVSESPRLVSELVELLLIEQSLLSHHLKVLREADLVRSVAEGQARRYHVVSARSHGDALDLGCCQLTFKPPRP